MNLKKYNNFVICFITILFMVVIVIITLLVPDYYDEKKSKDKSNVQSLGFSTRNFETILDVYEDGTIDVTENILVDWYSSNHHGITRTIPKWLEYTDKNGETRSRRYTISNLTCTTDEYSLIQGNKVTIKIGNPNEYVPLGEHRYAIKYKLTLDKDLSDGFDELTIHTIGDNWYETEKASVIVNLPSNFDMSKIMDKSTTKAINYSGFYSTELSKVEDDSNIQVYTNKKRQNSKLPYCNVNVSDHTITYNYNEPLYNSALTIDIILPDGYFKGKTIVTGYGYFSFIICIYIILMTILSVLIWGLVGKDSKEVEPVEFYPPDNLDPAEIGYLNNKWGVPINFISCLLIEMAYKGYIRIDDVKEEAIVNKKNNNENAIKHTYYFINRVLKDPKVFRNNTQYNIENLVLSNINDLKPLSENEKILYDKMFENNDIIILKDEKDFNLVYNKIEDNINKKFGEKLYDIKTLKLSIFFMINSLISIILWALAFSTIKDMNLIFRPLYYISLVSVIFEIVFSFIIPRKTNYGNQIFGKVQGFKNYLKTAHKEQLEKMVNENPLYYADILPYTYSLNISDVWIKKFEEMALPMNMYSNIGNADLSNTSFSSNFYYSSSSDSSSGGGCSSCGGGCSSCGGGGSW